MRRHIALTLPLVAALFAAGCAPLRVTTYFERGASMADHRVFQWEDPSEARPTGDPRLDSNPFFHGYLQRAIEGQLVRRGYVDATTAGLPADFHLHVHASVSQRLDVEDDSRTCIPPECRRSVVEYDEGSIVIDATDAGGERPIWRGVARDSVQGIIDDQSTMEAEIDRVVARLFADFPGVPERR